MNLNKLLFLLTVLFLTSCSKTVYQIGYVDSEDVPKNNNTYMYSNDDIDLIYNFWGNGGVLDIAINNKRDRPIYIDWTRSNFIFNNISYNYFTNTENVTLNSLGIYNSFTQLSTSSASSKTRREKSGITKGIVQRELETEQVPPKSLVRAKAIPLGFPVYKLKKNQVVRFGKEDTPLKFRSYLAYSYNKNPPDEEYLFIDNNFWVSGITRSTFKEYQAMESTDRFYSKGTTSSGGGTVVLIIVIFLVLVSVGAM